MSGKCEACVLQWNYINNNLDKYKTTFNIISECCSSAYILINNQVESIAPRWEDIVLQWGGTVVCVDHMAWLQMT